MEPEMVAFLKRISTSIFVGVLWMVINSTIGIMYGYAFADGNISPGNVIFYIWFIASIPLMIWFYIRLWKTPPGE